ncbi:MAG: sigma-70 family RNA polymerase sigma factor [Bacteroidota bacterium]|nr:sigma-70 family RNA polymerase sigma factor [Bacteroidota bacterium]
MDKVLLKNIYEQYAGEIRRYIYYRLGNEDIANDILQDTFIKLWSNKYTYYPDKIRALLYKIAGGLFLDYIKKEKVHADYIEHLKFRFKENSEEDEQNQEFIERCENAMIVLTEKERTVFLMNKMEGYKYKEIAENLNLSVKAVEKRMSNAIKKIKIK